MSRAGEGSELNGVIGVDIGGTKMAAARVSSGGSLAGDIHAVASSGQSEEGLVDALLGLLNAEIRRNGPPQAVGLGCAGTVHRKSGVVVVSPNLPLRGTSLVSLVEDALDLPTFLDNDANVAALAEARVGAGIGAQHMLMVTLGTGVGGGLVLDGEVYRGASGAAGEVGHMVVKAGGEECRCGSKGCLEAYASGTALERIAGNLVREGEDGPMAALLQRGELDGLSVGRLAKEGDPGALRAVREVGWWLGVGLAGMANLLEPEIIVIGGGLVELGDILLDPAREVVQEEALSPVREGVDVRCARLGADAGILGAGLMAWEESGMSPEV